jgi:LysM repeat protein
MNKRPPISSTSNVISSYRKRRQRGNPLLIIILAVLLVLGGVGALIYWLAGTADNPISNMLATETYTPTVTPTPTSTNTPTSTVTETATPTITLTPTFSAPFNYRVQEGDNLTIIVKKFELGEIEGIAKVISLNPFGGTTEQGMPIGIDPVTLNIVPGQIILLPHPGYQLPTSTPVPEDLSRGSKLEYTVQSGDSLGRIAELFNTTVEAIMEENKITDPNLLNAGQVLVIPVNLVTPTPTRLPTSTSTMPGPGTELPTVTLTPIN